MDPVAQVFAQIGAATAHGEGMGQFFIQGRQLGLQEKQLGIQRDSLDLRSRMELQDSLLKTFAHEQVVKKLDEQVGNEAALSMLGKYVDSVISSNKADDPSTHLGISNIVDTNPRLRFDPRTREILEDYKWAAQKQQATKQFAATMLERAKVNPTGNAQDIASLDLAKQELAVATASGDPTRISSAQTKVDGFTAAVFPSGTEIATYDPVTGNPVTTVRMGGRASATKPVDPSVPTATNLTRLQTSARTGMDTIASVDDLLPRIRPDSVGILGNLSELVLDRLFPQFGMDTADPERMDTRTRIKSFAADAVKQLNNPDPRVSNDDRKILGEIPPNAKDWNLSSPKAISDLSTIRRLTAKSTVRDYGQMKLEPPPALFDALDYRDIQEIFKQGFLPYDTAFRELLKKPAPVAPPP